LPARCTTFLDELKNSKAAAKKKAIERVTSGRSYAASVGIWPWASWPEGTPPVDEWWEDQHCIDWLRSWIAEAQGQAVLERQEALEQALAEPQLRILAASERQAVRSAETTERHRQRVRERLSKGL
jgi:hypothetical protein